MKIIINESQLRLIIENEEEKDNLINFTHVYNSGVLPDEWDEMFEHMNTKKKKGNKYIGYYINGNVNLGHSNVTKLDYLVRVDGYLDLDDTQIKSLPMLSYVEGYLSLENTPLSEVTTREELRSKINVEGKIYLFW